jgi:hypothetical protein
MRPSSTMSRTTLFRLATRSSLMVLVVLLAALVHELSFASWFTPGFDFATYRDAAVSWVNGDGFYHARQLAGPYLITDLPRADILYPPIILPLLVPFVALPPQLWWAIPMALTIWAFVRMRPAPWTWPVLLVLWVWPASWMGYILGNPGMWVLAAEAWGLLYGWPAVFVLLKPTLAPFALVGSGHRSWWIALAVFVVACSLFGAMWIDWWRAAVVNPTNGGLAYGLAYVPTMLLPIVAWLGRDGRPLTLVLGTVGARARSLASAATSAPFRHG